MKKIMAACFLFLIKQNSYACVTCNKELQTQIYESTFYPNLLVMLLAFIVLAVLVVILSVFFTKRHTYITLKNPGYIYLNPVPLASTAIIIGIGLGGFIDGILLHQVLQWHEMLSNKIPVNTLNGKSVNMFWDGIFHLFCFIVVLVGILLLRKLLFRSNINRSGKLFGGGLLLGWGLFNLIEGAIDHHLLKLHNVKEFSASPAAWNFLFLGISVIMVIAGYLLIEYGSHYKRNKDINENIIY